MAVLFARIDKRLGAVGALFRWILRRVKPGAPSVAQNIDVVNRVATAAHRPNHLIHVGWIDIFVDRDDPLRIISTAGHLGSESECLCSMAGVTLLERNSGHTKATGGGWMRVDSLDSRDAEFVEVIPDTRGANDGEEPALFI